MDIVDFILISLIAGIISIAIMLPVTMFISFRSFERGWDPDNVTTPLVAAVGDLFYITCYCSSYFYNFCSKISCIFRVNSLYDNNSTCII